MHRLVSSLRGLAGFLFTSSCPLCQRSTNQPVCIDCHRQLQRCQLSPPLVASLSPTRSPILRSQESSRTQPPTRSPILVAWGSYQGTLKRAIAALKYDRHTTLARPLGHWLAESWATALQDSQPDFQKAGRRSEALLVVPIPIHPAKQQVRGFNQAELLAEHFCDRAGLRLVRHGLVRHRETEAQFTLAPQQREQNLTGAFRLGKDFLQQRPTGSVLLLDDIYTTGATARSAVQTLQQQGIPVRGIVVVATASEAIGRRTTTDFRPG